MRKRLPIALTLVLLLALSFTSGLFISKALADTWTQMNVDGFGNSNNKASTAINQTGGSSGAYCVGTRNTVTGCQVWDYYSSDKIWRKISPSDGFGNKNNTEITSIILDSAGHARYFGTKNTVTGCELWERKAGGTWRQIGEDGFGDNDNTEIASMRNYSGNYVLYVGTTNSTDGCEFFKVVYGSSTPVVTKLAGSGAPVGYGFGNPNNVSASSIVFSNQGNWHMFVGTRNTATGCEVWRYGGPTPSHFDKVGTNGFGDAHNTEITSSERQFGTTSLFFGTENKTNGCEVWKTNETPAQPFTDWAKLNTDDGFGDDNNSAASSISNVRNSTTNTDMVVGTYNDSSGCEIWLLNNNNWSKIGDHGFGNASNFNAYGIYMTASSGSRKIRVATGGGVPGGARVWDNYGEGPPPPPPPPNPVIWYLAEGTTAWGFSTYVTIENPNTTATTAKITYQTTDGAVNGGTVNLPAKSQTTVNPANTLGEKDFSTKVVSTEGKDIAVDRTMTWTGTGAPSPEGHSSIGVKAPAKTWYLPEGASAWGFECWLLIQNPGDTDATCEVTYMIENQAPQTKTKTVPANSRASFNMKDDIGEQNSSIKVVGSVPVIAERAMYRNSRREGHESIGTTTPAYDYYLAEGTTAWGFVTWLLIQNPSSTPAVVTVTYMTSSGPQPQAPFTLAANSRKTIRVNDVLPQIDFSTKVHASKKIIAERSMFWGDPTPSTEVCHDSIGTPNAHTAYYLPDGQTSEGRETWTLVQNPNSTAVSVEITYLTPTGTGNATFTDTVPANSRKTYNMAAKIRNSRAAIKVVSKTAGKKIIVERAMYWNNRGAGTETLGAYFD